MNQEGGTQKNNKQNMRSTLTLNCSSHISHSSHRTPTQKPHWTNLAITTTQNSTIWSSPKYALWKKACTKHCCTRLDTLLHPSIAPSFHSFLYDYNGKNPYYFIVLLLMNMICLLLLSFFHFFDFLPEDEMQRLLASFWVINHWIFLILINCWINCLCWLVVGIAVLT